MSSLATWFFSLPAPPHRATACCSTGATSMRTRRLLLVRRSRRRNRWRSDRKSTRLNSSHDEISYAVFCLKKQYIGDQIGLQGFSFENLVIREFTFRDI